MGPLEFIYYLGYSIKKAYNLKRRRRLPCRVVSVGNLTLGGTGKTPAVIAIAEEAEKRGYRPCILTRGYKGKAAGPCFISKGDGPLLDAYEAGDEALLMAERLKGIPVVKGKDRYDTGIFAMRSLESEVASGKSKMLFILDDGFQHWKLFRDKDILLIDSTNPFGNNRLFPSGILREPLSEMERADVIVITKVRKDDPEHGRVTSGLIEEIRIHNRKAPIFMSKHRPISLGTLSGSELPLEKISGRTIFGFCGIGNPASFQDTLLTLGVKVRGFMAFGDHHRYSHQDVRRITEAAKRYGTDWIVTTEKDIIKFKGFDIPENNIVSLRIAFGIEKGFYEDLFSEG